MKIMDTNPAGPGGYTLGEEAFVCAPSFAQQRLWFLNQLDRDTSAYNVALTFRVTGPLDAAVLERALGEIVRRHESLRTTFEIVDGELAQVIAAHGSVTFPIRNLQGIPVDAREFAAQEALTEETRRPFDLREGPLFRAVLWQLGPEEHVLMLNMHHIVSDGWSFNVLRREMGALYEAFLHQKLKAGNHPCSISSDIPAASEQPSVTSHEPRATSREQPILPELPIQYADFAEWQRDWLKGDALQSQFSYWKEKIGAWRPF